jgi:hypothetical protein
MTESTDPSESVDAAMRRRPPRLNLERARAMIAEWRASGLGRAEYAARRGISLKTFDRWRSRVEGGRRKTAGGLARVTLAASGGETTGVPFVLAGTPPRVVLPPDWDAACLRRVLEGCRC